MNALDYLLLAGILFSTLVAASQGFFFEVFGLAGTVIGYLLAVWQYSRLAPFVLPYVKEAWIANLTAFFVIFLLVTLAASGIGRIARWGAREAGLRWFDHLLGGAFGLVRAALLATVLVLGLAAFSPGSRLLARSELAPYFLLCGRAAVWVAPTVVRQQFRAGVQALNRASPGLSQQSLVR